MSAEPRQFVDTNVVVYMYDDREPIKQERARALVRDLSSTGKAAVSIQVLQEFYMTVTRRLVPPLSPDAAFRALTSMAAFRTHSPAVSDVTAAVDLSITRRISFWDAMLVRSASQLECKVLWTEDLSSGQTIAGVEIRNPFLES